MAIAVCLGAAVVGEVRLLQRTHLGVAYLGILGAETVIIMLAAAWMGEGLSGCEVAGGLIVLVGAGVLST